MTHIADPIIRAPWLLRITLRLLVDSEERDSILSDLSELHHHHVEQFGEQSANHWLRRQPRQYALRLIADRFRGPSTQSPASQSPVSREWFANTMRDLKHGVRTLIRAPVFTLTVALTVGLGIGGTTAVFRTHR